MYDCIIVGAGPAGSSTAYHLAQQGHTVLILEKRVWPRSKPCSGAVSPIVAQWFDFEFAPAIERELRRVRYTWKLADEIVAELTTQASVWIVDRAIFDTFLVQQAIGQGALLKDQTPATGIEFKQDGWVVHTPQGPFQGKYLVAADGAEGPLSEWLGFPAHKLKSGAVCEIPTAAPIADTCALNFEFGLVKNGCLWCFPKQQGYLMGAATFLGQPSQDYPQAFAQYAPAFGVHYDQGATYSHALKLWEGDRPFHTQQAVVVGEAAGIVDPLSAEGIRHGMYSGVQAAKAIHAALQGQSDALTGYTEAMQVWGNNMQWAQRIASIFYRVPGLGYRVGIKRPSMTTRMGQLLAGEIQYVDIANRVIKRLSTGFIPGRK